MKKQLLFFLIFLQSLTIIPLFSSEKSETEELRAYFKDILLIINFNHPFYKNIEFLKEIYSPYFPNIVFYGEESHPGVYKIDHHRGWYVHKAVCDAMTRWPHYRGYICCQDDCFMNFWNFPRLNKDKIWLHNFWTQSLNSPNPSWPWWNLSCGQEASLKAYKKLPKKNRALLKKNCGDNHFAYSWADFFYISGKYRKEFMRVSHAFSNPNVFIEIAIPTIVLCLTDNKKIEKLNPYWGGTINTIPLESYDLKFDWIHPIKFSSEENRQFIREVLRNIVN